MKRGPSFLIILGIYVLAIAAAGTVFWQLFTHLHILLNLFIADTVATIVVWIFGLIFKNSSVYDPYWSVVPPVVALTYFLLKEKMTVNDILILIAVFAWAVRLTANWAYTFKGLRFQDWRYTQYKTNFPKVWFFVNFFGINYMPTCLVFLGMLPLYAFYTGSPVQLDAFTVAGTAICLLSAFLQLVADTQLHKFRKANAGSGKTIDKGLWRFSRHPNYLGEVSFWWGVFIAGASFAPWWTVAGGLFMTFLFCFVSIPLMEKHMVQKRPSYAEYKKQVSMILILPRKNLSEDTTQQTISAD